MARFAAVFAAALLFAAPASYGLNLAPEQVSEALSKAARYPSAMAATIPVNESILAGAPSVDGPVQIWTKTLEVGTSRMVVLHATQVSLPPGSTIKVSGASGGDKQQVGAGGLKTYWSAPVGGPTVLIEVAVPRGEGQPLLILDAVDVQILGAAPKKVTMAKVMAVTEPDGSVNYSCVQSAANTPLSRATVSMNLRKPDAVLLCTGTLVNNTLLDAKPYILSATHCEAYTPEITSERRFVWDATVPCGDSINITAAAVSSVVNDGASIVATYGDVRLYLLNAPPPPEANAFWYGWDITNTTVSLGEQLGRERFGQSGEFYGVHHAGNRPKQWVRDTDGLICLERFVSTSPTICGDDPDDTDCPAWNIHFEAPEDGQLSNGGSGSALSNGAQRMIGVASAIVAADFCTGRFLDGFNAGLYSTLNKAWPGSATPETSMRPWLDPLGGSLTLDGSDFATPSAPEVDLSSTLSSVSTGAPFNLSWATSNVSNCTRSGGWTGASPLSGSLTVTAPSTPGPATYTLTCSDGTTSAADSVTVTVVAPPAPTVDLMSAQSTVTTNSPIALTWTSSGVSSCTRSDGWSGASPLTGSTSVTSPATAGSVSYTLTCTNGTATATDTVTVAVTAPKVPTVDLMSDKASVPTNGALALTWTSENATSCTRSGRWAGPSPLTGTLSTTAPGTAGTVVYTLTCTDGTTTATDSVSVTVTPVTPPTVDLSASQTSVKTNTLFTLSWTSSNATSCARSGSWSGASALTGSTTAMSLATAGSMSFTLSCTNGTTSASDTVSVIVTSEPVTPPVTPPVVSISVTPARVSALAPYQINWSTTNATSCAASGSWSGAKSTSGTESGVAGATGATYSFTLSCAGPGGSASQSATLVIDAPPPTTPAPTLSLGAAPATVSVGGNYQITWSSTAAASCSASGGWMGAKGINGSESFAAPATAGNVVHTLACTGTGGTATRSVTVTVQAVPTDVPKPESGGGGGAFGLEFGLAAILLGLIRRRFMPV